MATQRLVFALDLKDDPALQAEYRRHHQAVPPAILASIRESGVLAMEIYEWNDRLVMIMEVAENYNRAESAA